MPISQFVEILIPPLTQAYTYGLPQEVSAQIEIGHAVTVNFNRRHVQGFVISKLCSRPLTNKNFEIKNISASDKFFRAFTDEQLKFFEWIAAYYQEPLSNVVDTAVPRYRQPKEDFIVSLKNKECSLRGSKQNKILALIKNSVGPCLLSQINATVKDSNAVIRKLIEQQILQIESYQPTVNFDLQKLKDQGREILLTEDQQKAVKAITTEIDQKDFKAFLLYGVTGSGKTEVYLESIRHALAQGKSALIIVPEIALTPQLIERFSARLKAPTAVLHSAMPERERWLNWQAILDDRAKVVIGARSALFAPLKNIGIIVIDEEHESSYKQADGFRYHARDLAVLRAKLNKIPVVMGSATPALESIYNVQKKKYSLLKLTTRFAATQKNTVTLLNLKMERRQMASSSISNKLKDKIKAALDRKEQVFIMYNRRGYAAYLECQECGESVKCKHCSVTLTWHQADNTLLCHTCGYSQTKPGGCQACLQNPEKALQGKDTLKLLGFGTEKVHLELQELFPTARILRMDRDSVKKFEDYKSILSAVKNGAADILVGTQMIAKGHDLPNVTLVGMINADVGLHIPDFRSAEKVFQLITQASGRAGRADKPGEVLIQTRDPGHPAVKFSAAADYLSFANHELRIRKDLNYPPFCRLLRILFVSKTEPAAKKTALQIAAGLRKLQERDNLNMSILGPVAPALAKLKSNYRYHIIIKTNEQLVIQKTLYSLSKIKKISSCRISWDLDPQDLL